VVAYGVGAILELLQSSTRSPVPPGAETSFADAVEKLLLDSDFVSNWTQALQFAQETSASIACASATLNSMFASPEKVPREFRRMSEPEPSPGKRLRVCIVAPSLRYVGRTAVRQTCSRGTGRTIRRTQLLAVDPPLRRLAWAESIPGLRTILREPSTSGTLGGLKEGTLLTLFPRPIGHSCSLPTRMVDAKARGPRA